MEKLIRGQRAKINGLYDDLVSLTIVESEELCDILDSFIKPLDSNEQ